MWSFALFENKITYSRYTSSKVHFTEASIKSIALWNLTRELWSPKVTQNIYIFHDVNRRSSYRDRMGRSIFSNNLFWRPESRRSLRYREILCTRPLEELGTNHELLSSSTVVNRWKNKRSVFLGDEKYCRSPFRLGRFCNVHRYELFNLFFLYLAFSRARSIRRTSDRTGVWWIDL